MSSIDLQRELYGKPNYSAFNKLCNRLRERLLDVMLLSVNQIPSKNSKRNLAIMEIKKNLIISDVLSQKGLRDEAERVINKTLLNVNKFELFDLKVQALMSKEKLINLRKSATAIARNQNEIKDAERKQKSLHYCQQIYSALINKIANSTSYRRYFNDLENVIEELEAQLKISQSYQIEFFLNFLKTEKFQIENNFTAANSSLKRLEQLTSMDVLYSETRRGTIYLNLAGNFIHLRNFRDAEIYALKAQRYFPNNMLNRALVAEIQFYSSMYQDKFHEADEYLKSLLNTPIESSIQYRYDRWRFFESSLLFISKRYNQALSELNRIKEIDKDKEGWNVNKRILAILCRIELGDLNSIDTSIVNLEKFIKRIDKLEFLKPRYKIILRILVKLLNSNMNYLEVYRSRIKYFELLTGDDVNYKWDLKGPELIPFHLWFKSKLEGKVISFHDSIS
ncbi:MAG: hypothetical protein U0X76_03525 [Bacteroidia bacterium]